MRISYYLDRQTLRDCLHETDLEGEWPERFSQSIVPFSLLDESLLTGQVNRGRPGRGLLDLDPPPRFDLIIVDEAHHVRNSETQAHRVVERLCANAEAVVFLSATPVQMGTRDLFNLLRLLRPDIIQSFRDFERMAAPNPFLNQAVAAARGGAPGWQDTARTAIEAALETTWGKGVLRDDPRLQGAYDRLAEVKLDDEARVKLVRDLSRPQRSLDSLTGHDAEISAASQPARPRTYESDHFRTGEVTRRCVGSFRSNTS